MKTILFSLMVIVLSQSLSAQRIYELYTAGGASGSATWDADYIILSGFTANQNVAGWSIQNRGSGTTWSSTTLTGNADANGFFRFRTVNSPSGNVPFTPQMSGNLIQFTNTGSGQVALFSPVSGTTPAALTTAGTCPSGGQLVDLVGYIGSTTGTNSACFEGTGSAPATSAAGTQSRRRKTNTNSNGIDTNNNANDFELINNPYVCTNPTAYTVTGGGSYCSGGTGVAVGLANSETGVTYQLFNGASTAGSPVSGTGSAISFGSQTSAGTYTVVATRTTGGCTATMTGSVAVSINSAPTAGITGTTTGCGSVSLTATGGTGYAWSGGSSTSTAMNTFTTSGTYTVTVTGSNGCTNTASAAVTVTTAPSTLFVDQNIGSSGNGATWGAALKTLDEALTIAHNCPGVTTINVAAGTYKPTLKPYENGTPITTADARDVTFHLANGVAMYGGFNAGTGTRDIAANPTILSGDIGTTNDNTDNAYHVVLSVSDGATTLLDGFTVTGGNADFDATIIVEGEIIEQQSGGGMFNFNSSPNITYVTFTGNSAIEKGGGMYNVNPSAPTITNTAFSGNSATYGGGMANAYSANPIITNTTFSGNEAFLGGGMRNELSSSPTIINCTFTGNAAAFGDGMYNSDGVSPVIANSILWGNGTEIATFDSSYPTVTYSIVQGGYTGCSNCPGTNGNADPLFVNAADPDGADNIHRTADDGLRLQTGSPAINVGDNNLIPTGITTDITGATRIQNTTVDLGAYEGGVFVCPTGNTLHVDQSVTASGNGATWATALKTLAEALTIAHNCPGVTTINVAAGTYKPTLKPYASGTPITTANARDVTFHLPNGVALYGGFNAGTGTRDIAANPTILSGDIGTPNDNTDNAYHVVLSVSDGATTLLDGFTVTGGNANSGSTMNVESQ